VYLSKGAFCVRSKGVFFKRSGYLNGNGEWIFALELTPAGHAGPPSSHPACRSPGFERRSGCVPAEPCPPLKQPTRLQIKISPTMGSEHYSPFARTDLSPFVRTTTSGRNAEIEKSFNLWKNKFF